MFKKPSIIIPEPVQIICAKLNQHGYQSYVVGGAVRDALLRKPPTDWDVATDAHPENVQQLFSKTIPTGAKYGTVTVVIDDALIEVTTMRRDANYSDARRPDYVIYTDNINEDLARRDFTVNAIAYNPSTQQFIDPFGGMKDLYRRILRTVGDPQARFREDALRMLRLIRFIAVLDFQPDRQTVAGIQPELITYVAEERIKDELSKLLVASSIAKSLELMYTSGLMTQILPELARTAGVKQGAYHYWDVLGHSIMTAQAIQPQLHLRLAALLHDIGKPLTFSEDENGIHFYGHELIGAEIAQNILQRLTFSKQLQNQVSLLIKYHMYQVHPHSTDKAIRRLIHAVGKENIFDLIELRKADILGMRHNPRQVWEYYQNMISRIDALLKAADVFTLSDLALTGHDLIRELGLQPSPTIGTVLNYLLELVLDNPELNTKPQLLALAQEYISRSC